MSNFRYFLGGFGITSKTITDAAFAAGEFEVVSNVLRFNAGGGKVIEFNGTGSTASKIATLAFINTTDQTYTFPNVAGTLLITNVSNILFGPAKLDDSTVVFADTANPNNTLKFDINSTAGTKEAKIALTASNQTYTIPDTATTASFVLTEEDQTINGNKTLSGVTALTSLALTALGILRLDALKNIVTGTVAFSELTGTLAHSVLTGSTTGDDHTQYVLLAGRTGGQTITGGIAASNNLVLRSTTHGTKGQIYVDEATASTSTITGAFRVVGGVGIAGDLYINSISSDAATALTFGINGVTKYSLKTTGAINVVGGASDPAGAAGDLYYRTDTNTYRYYNGAVWDDIGAGKYISTLFTGTTFAATRKGFQRWVFNDTADQVLASINVTDLIDGTIIILYNPTDYGLTVQDNRGAANGFVLNGDLILYKYFTLKLMWDSTAARFIELSRGIF